MREIELKPTRKWPSSWNWPSECDQDITFQENALHSMQSVFSKRYNFRLRRNHRDGCSDQYPLNLVERDFIAGPIIELCGAWRFVSGNSLGVFQSAAVQKVCRNSRCSERVVSDCLGDSRSSCPPLDHRKGFPATQSALGEFSMSVNAAKQRSSLCMVDSRSRDVVVNVGVCVVVRWDRVFFAALLVQTKPPPLAAGVGKIVIDEHIEHCGNACEAIDHDADQRLVAQPDDGTAVD